MNRPVRASAREVKEFLPVAARALKLTIQAWEVRTANDFDESFCGDGQAAVRMDSTYPASPLITTNQKRIGAFALRSRLPSMYDSRAAVDAGGLMSYGADEAENHRRVAYLRRQDLEGSQACRSAG